MIEVSLEAFGIKLKQRCKIGTKTAPLNRFCFWFKYSFSIRNFTARYAKVPGLLKSSPQILLQKFSFPSIFVRTLTVTCRECLCIDWCVRYFYVGFHNVFTPFIGLLKIEIKQFLMSENFQFIHLNNITRSQKWWQFRIYYFGLLPCPAPLGRGAPHPCLIIVVDKPPCQHQGSPKKSVFQTQTVIYQKVS